MKNVKTKTVHSRGLTNTPFTRTRIPSIFLKTPTAWAVILFSLLITFWAWHGVRTAVYEGAKDRFQIQTEILRESIKDRMLGYELGLRGGAGLFAASISVERHEWREYVKGLQIGQHYPGIQGIGFVEFVPAVDRDKHIARVRAEGFADYNLVPDGTRPEYTAIIYLEPFDARNQRALGYDMFAEPVRRAAMERARDTGLTSVTGMVRLVQDSEYDRQPGFLMYLPVYRNGAATNTTAERRAALVGYVYSPFRLGDLMPGIFGRETPFEDFIIYDGPGTTPAALMYDSSSESPKKHSLDAPLFQQTLTLEIGGRIWTLVIRTTPAFAASIDKQKAMITLAAGLITSILLFGIVWSLTSDISRRKKAEEALRESEERKGAILASALDCILSIDHEGRITEFNPAAERLFGYSREEVIGQNMAERIIPPSLRDRHSAGMARYLAGGESTFLGRRIELVAMRADGTEFPVEIAVTPVQRKGPPMFTGYIRDLSERKRAEDALRLAEEKLRQSQKLEAIGRLAGGIAHDFNNLLTAIIGYSDILLNHPHDDRLMRTRISEIKKAGERAAALTGQLLAFSRKQILQPKVLDLNKVVAGSAEMLGRLIGEDIELISKLDPRLKSVKADPGQMEQVILNLAVNARDAMPAGGRLAIETANMEVEYATNGQPEGVTPGSYITLTVSDNGSGMDEETKMHLFEPFYTTKEKGKGTGLGLSTVFGIVKQSGGHLAVNSELGQGTSITIYLPQTDEISGQTESSEISDRAPHGAETVLVVEDETAVRELVREFLTSSGYLVLEAEDPDGAIRIFREHVGRIDLLLSDVVMPKMSGRELAIKLLTTDRNMKVLFMSGYPDSAMTQHGSLLPGTEFLQKPFSRDALIRKIREVLDEEKRPVV